MDADSYTSKQQLLQSYRSNLQKLDHKIAKYGGFDYAPLDVQNQYDDTKKIIDHLQQELAQYNR